MAVDHLTIPCAVEGCKRPVSRRGWCNMHYLRWNRHGDPLKAKFFRLDSLANFWERVTRDGPIPPVCPELGPCWLWTGSKTPLGYGHFSFQGKKRYASVVSWFIATGQWPGDLDTLHRCDNPSCVNPAHLFLGTHQDNMTDRNQKSRQAHGERQGAAKLTDELVKAIRADRTAGATQISLAARYGVCRRTIRSIIARKTWRHL